MAEIADLSTTDASNTARFPEGQLAPTVNNGARALEGMIGRHHRDNSGYTLTSGSSTAYQIIPAGAYASHATGNTFLIRCHVACGAAPTITIGALSAKPLRRQGGGVIVPGDIAVNQQIFISYNSALDVYEVIGLGDNSPTVPTLTVAALPTTGPNLAIASDGRKNGETTGNGTGVLAFRVGTSWFACDTGAAVAS